MRDPRLQRLAKSLLEYSVGIKEGDKVLLRGNVSTKPLLKELVKKTYELKAYPFIELMDDELTREVMLGNTEERIKQTVDWSLQKIKDVDALVSVYAQENDSEFSDIPGEIKLLNSKLRKPFMDIVTKEKRWVLLNYPTPGLAQKAKMSMDKFTDFLLDVCTVDYSEMSKAMKPLVELMERTDKVRIVGPGTDLTFSIKDIPAVPCAGECNIPDGEIFTAPIKNSVNGTIQYNTPSPYRGVVFKNVKFTFKDGKIIEATADSNVDELNDILDTDDGARYIGEFAIGVNPMIKDPMGDILFDEKIDGSFHFTPGQAYEGEADNGNKSAVHWDLVLIQRPEYGGGEIYFDDVLIRKDGRFVLPELEVLNPENL